MAVYTFGIDADQDVKRAFSDAGLNVAPGTRPLNDQAVTDAIANASANVISLADAVGIVADAALLTNAEATHERLKRMAIAGAIEELAIRHGRMDELATRWRERFQSIRSELLSGPATFGTGAPGIADVPHIVDDVQTVAADEIGDWNWEDTEGVW